MPYVAIINTPGYLPTVDEPPTFDTASEAWSYLADERREDEDSAEVESDSDTRDALDSMAAACVGITGTIYGSTPGYDGDHDLGLAYTVELVDETVECTECGRADVVTPEGDDPRCYRHDPNRFDSHV